jgi:hypothetical protein
LITHVPRAVPLNDTVEPTIEQIVVADESIVNYTVRIDVAVAVTF